MSIIIKGMEMQKNCCYCPCMHYIRHSKSDKYFMVCHAVNSSFDRTNVIAEELSERDLVDLTGKVKTPHWCPLVELPQHGDLIDRGAFLRWLDMQNQMWVRSYTTDDLREMLRKGIPTVVPAERSGE